MNNEPFKRDLKKRTEYPKDVERSQVLRKSEISVLIHLASHLPNAFPSIDRLAEECNVSRETVKRALRTLRQYGAIKFIGKAGYHRRANKYMVFDTPAMWVATTKEEFMEACQLAQEEYDNKVVVLTKKESPASVGADAGEVARVNNIVGDYCTTINNVCQPNIMEVIPWASRENCEKFVDEAKKVVQEEEIEDYLRFCTAQMEKEEAKGKIIKSRVAYLITVIRRMAEPYKHRSLPVETQQYDSKYDDDTERLFRLTHEESQINDT